MLDLDDDWVWDFWLTTDGPDTHVFFLHAPRSLGDPDLRHVNARVGHAVSTDLITWRRLPEVLAAAPGPSFDDRAIWTGSVVSGDDGLWRLFYSSLSHGDPVPITQHVGLATSPDLVTWTRDDSGRWPLEPDPRWYAVAEPGLPAPHWRDPYVVRDPDGLWHMYLTATAAGAGPGSGVVGHAVSRDLEHWDLTEPLSTVPNRFDQLEVIQVVEVDGHWVLVFSCLAPEIPGAEAGSGGTWVVEVDGPGAAVDLSRAVRLTDESLYVAKLARTPDGWGVLAFRHQDENGVFVGGIIDPIPVRWDPERDSLEGFSKNAGRDASAPLL